MVLVHEKRAAAQATLLPINRKTQENRNPVTSNNTRSVGVFVRLSRSMLIALLASQAAVFVSGLALMIGGH